MRYIHPKRLWSRVQLDGFKRAGWRMWTYIRVSRISVNFLLLVSPISYFFSASSCVHPPFLSVLVDAVCSRPPRLKGAMRTARVAADIELCKCAHHRSCPRYFFSRSSRFSSFFLFVSFFIFQYPVVQSLAFSLLFRALSRSSILPSSPFSFGFCLAVLVLFLRHQCFAR